MSGICSAHQGHEPGCSRCEAIPTHTDRDAANYIRWTQAEKDLTAAREKIAELTQDHGVADIYAERDALKSQVSQLEAERDKLIAAVGEHLAVRLERTRERDQLEATVAGFHSMWDAAKDFTMAAACEVCDCIQVDRYEDARVELAKQLGALSLSPDAGKQMLENVSQLEATLKLVRADRDAEWDRADKLEDAVKHFKENEHTEKRGQALRSLWAALAASPSDYSHKIEKLVDAVKAITRRGNGAGGCDVVTTKTLRTMAAEALKEWSTP